MEQLNLTLQDQATVSMQLYPVEQTDAPVLLFFPAMGVRAEFYSPFAASLNQEGITLITADLRGLGTSSVRPSSSVDFGYKEMLGDFEVIVQKTKEQFPTAPLYIGGHSLGGQLACLHASKHPEDIEGLVLIAACSIYYKGWRGGERLKTRLGITLFPKLSKWFGYFPGDKVGFGGKASKTMLLDWSHVGKTSRYEVIGDDFDYETAMSNTVIPIFAAAIEGDWMAPEMAIKNLYQKFHTAAPVHPFTLKYKEVGKQLNHFNWVKNGGLLAQELTAWLAKSQGIKS